MWTFGLIDASKAKQPPDTQRQPPDFDDDLSDLRATYEQHRQAPQGLMLMLCFLCVKDDSPDNKKVQ
jgi:hypothetical protein